MEIAKAGWVYRLSSVLRRWKRCWLVLYTNGHLAYFDSPDKHQPEEVIILPGRLAALHRGSDVTNQHSPPEGRGADSIVQLLAGDGEEVLMFSADNGDDAAAWHIAIDQARVSRAASAPPPYASPHNPSAPPQMAGYPQQMAGYPQQMAGAPPPGYAGQPYPYYQPTTIIVEREPYYGGYGYGYDPMIGMGYGAMSGLALGSMMGMGMGWGWGHHGCYW